MFFRNKPKKELRSPDYESGVQSFETALILISVGKHGAALVSFFSSLEAFLSDEKNLIDGRDKRNFWEKMVLFAEMHPKYQTEFERRSESTRNIKKEIYRVYQLRNQIIHSGHSSRHNQAAIEAILKELLPLIQIVYRALFDNELYENLVVEIREYLDISQFLVATQKPNGGDWFIALSPVIWGVQVYISPTFSPKYLYDSSGYQVDAGEQIQAALWSLNNMDEIGITCPICSAHSIAAKFGFDSEIKPFNLFFEEVTCVNCQLEIGSSSTGRALSSSLFDTFITQNEVRIITECGLR